MKVTIRDFSNWDSRRQNNGGAYGFWEEYTQLPTLLNGEPAFEVRYFTTAEFDYCEFCGNFSCSCWKEPEIVTLTDLQQRIKAAEDHPSDQVEAVIEGELKEADWPKIRRRVEDALRKTSDNNLIFKVATIVNAKIW